MFAQTLLKSNVNTTLHPHLFPLMGIDEVVFQSSVVTHGQHCFEGLEYFTKYIHGCMVEGTTSLYVRYASMPYCIYKYR